MKTAFVYVTDQRGFELARHSAVSVALSQRAPCDIHVFCHQFAPGEQQALAETLAAHGKRLRLHGISDPEVENHQTCGHVTTPTLLKLAAVGEVIGQGDVTGQYDRVVYLDNDVLVVKDLMLDTISFGSAPIAAVIDMDLSTSGVMRHSPWVAGGTAGTAADYFNAGFMVFAAGNWRGAEFQAAYAVALHRHDAGCSYKIDCTSIDQCALNSVFARSWIRLPATYNMQAGAKFTGFWKTASVRHYCGPRKFLPLAPFRSDSHDVRMLNRIRRAMRLPEQKFPLLYEVLFQCNVVRNRRPARRMQRFLRAAGIQGHVGAEAA